MTKKNSFLHNIFRANQRSDRFILLLEGQATVRFPKVSILNIEKQIIIFLVKYVF
jgi:hypothetical protein